jgi:hypothetical protein
VSSTEAPVRTKLPRYERRFRTVLAVVPTIAVLSFLTAWLISPSEGGGYPKTATDWLQVLAGLVCFGATFMTLLIAVGRVSFSRYENTQRRRAASADQVLSEDTRPPVLYFRSFDDDVQETDFIRALNTVNVALENSAEEVLSEYLKCIGPVVAIGRPGEALPELGFARMYVEQEHWQSRVLDLIDRASLVVLRAGHSAGVLWETGQVLRQSVLPRVIVIVPSTTGFDFDKYREQVRRVAAINLPELPKSSIKRFPLGVRAIIRFESDGSPCLCDFPEPGLPPPNWTLIKCLYRWNVRRGIPWFRPQTVDFSSFLVSALGPVLANHSLTFVADDPAKEWDGRWRPTKFDRVARWVVIAIVVVVAGLVIFAGVVLLISGG